MTVKEFILKTVDSYVDFVVCEYKNDVCLRRFTMEKHKWHCSNLPEDILDKEVVSIVLSYDRIVLEVNVE